MGDLFSNMLSSSESLFLNDMALDFEFLPKIMKYREEQQQYIAICIKPLFNSRNGKNLIITGQPGIGKTAAVKYLLRELEEQTDEIYTIYVNCWKKDTPFKIMCDICDQLGYKWTHDKRFDELLKIVAELINKKSAVIVLDEFDKISEEGVIYSLLDEIYKKCMILITNNETSIVRLDNRIKSRLGPEMINFKSYNFEETKGVLAQRKEYAFVKNAWDGEAFQKITERTFEEGDIRLGLYLMRESGNIAENESSKKISLKHAELALTRITDFKNKDINILNNENKKILELIKNNSGLSANEIYDEYCQGGGEKSYRTFYRKIKGLEKDGIITIKETKEGHPGRSSFVYYTALNEF